MFSLLNDCHMLVESTTSIICSLDAGLEKKRLSFLPRRERPLLAGNGINDF